MRNNRAVFLTGMDRMNRIFLFSFMIAAILRRFEFWKKSTSPDRNISHSLNNSHTLLVISESYSKWIQLNTVSISYIIQLNSESISYIIQLKIVTYGLNFYHFRYIIILRQLQNYRFAGIQNLESRNQNKIRTQIRIYSDY